MTFVDEKNRQRRRSDRVRTACITCKKRHVKCGEEKPSCKRCISAKRICSYELTTVAYQKPTSLSLCRRSSPDSVVSVPDQPSQAFQGEDLRSLEFFLERVSKLVDTRCPDLWNKTVPQLAQHKPALRHALVALSGVHEHATCGTNLTPHSLQKYNMAIRSLLTAEGKADALIEQLLGCLLFVVIEFLQGNVSMAVELVKAGRRIVYASRMLKKTNAQQAMSQPIEDSFRRLDAHIAGMCHDATDSELSFGECWELDGERPLPDMSTFKDYVHAQRALGLLMNAWGVARSSDQFDRDRFYHALQEWKKSFQKLEIQNQATSLGMQMWFLENEILMLSGANIDTDVATTFVGEGSWDRFHEQFKKMVDLAECVDWSVYACSATFSLAHGISMVMFRTAIRCKDPRIRKRAIEVIRVANRQEGLLKPSWMIKICNSIIELEEAGRDVRQASDIPEDARLQDLRIAWTDGQGSMPIVRYRIHNRIVVEPLDETKVALSQTDLKHEALVNHRRLERYSVPPV